MTNLIIIRHCQATGQEPEAQLTIEGFQQAEELVQFLEPYRIARIITSPYTRTIQTITPYALSNNIQIEVDDRLKERILSSENLPDWYEKLQQSFENPNLKFIGGESGQEATERILTIVNDLSDDDSEYIALVTHGNLTALLLNHISREFGFEDWLQLSNPDVYMLESNLGELHYRRIWK